MNLAGMVCSESTNSRLNGLASADQPPAQSVVSQLLVGLYKGVCRTGLLSTRLGRAAFLAAYERYKGIWDADQLTALAKCVRRGTTVIDVGANGGFYTRRFAEWVRPAGEVIAIEPEELNFSTLKRVIARRGLMNVLAVQAAASESAGGLYLQKNRIGPTGHLTAGRGVNLEAVTIDDVLRGRGWPNVSLIKIDVQGAEERVLRGAMQTLEELRPAVFVQVDEAALRSMGSSAESVLELMASFRYEAYRIVNERIVKASRSDVVSLCKRGVCVALLFLPANHSEGQRSLASGIPQ